LRENNINEYSIGRVYAQHRNLYKIITEKGEISATLSGKLQYELINKKDYPVVGDWVNYEELGYGEGIIHQIQERKTLICRKVAGVKSEEQALAANIDKIFITMSLNNNFNLRRLERYINIAWDIIKSDDTVVFIGSSGVGKSTIINKLLEKEVQITKEVDEYDKGRHTTTHRELFVLPTGGAIIDTPGMRELQLSQGDVEATFKDIEDLALKCHFSDCKHKSEPKCAVQQAIERGELSKERFISYEKIKKEIANEEKRRKAKERINERKARIRR